MTFRTVVRDGLIVINTHGEIPDGTPVEVVPISNGAKKKSKGVARRSTSRQKSVDSFLALAGIWKDRPEMKGKSSIEIAAELRRLAMGERYGRRDRR